jgi:hypothetical protein
MSIVTTERTQPSKLLLILLALATAGALAYGALRSSPLSLHAKTSHAQEAYNATTILGRINRSTCQEVKCFDCPKVQHFKILCRINSELWGGLIIGYNRMIITGYAARYSYWDKSIIADGCVPAAFLP